MIEGLLFIFLGVLVIVVAYIGPDKVNRTRREFIAEWDKRRGKSPEYTANRYSRPHYVIALMGGTLALFGVLQVLESILQ